MRITKKNKEKLKKLRKEIGYDEALLLFRDRTLRYYVEWGLVVKSGKKFNYKFKLSDKGREEVSNGK